MSNQIDVMQMIRNNPKIFLDKEMDQELRSKFLETMVEFLKQKGEDGDIAIRSVLGDDFPVDQVAGMVMFYHLKKEHDTGTKLLMEMNSMQSIEMEEGDMIQIVQVLENLEVIQKLLKEPAFIRFIQGLLAELFRVAVNFGNTEVR